MRHSPELIARVIGQMDCDDENVRLVAFGKARDMLKAAGITFADLAAAHAERNQRPAANDRTGETPSAPARRKPTLDGIPEVGAYLHEPRVGRWTRRVDGKRVIRGEEPPHDISGRLRVLKDVATFPNVPKSTFRTMTLSFETADALYEPFVMERCDPVWLKHVRNRSETGSPVRFV